MSGNNQLEGAVLCCDKNPCSSPSGFFSIPPIQFSLFSAVIGVLLTKNLDLGQQNSLGNFVVGIGQSILTIAAQGELLKNEKEKDCNDDLKCQLQTMQEQIDKLEKMIICKT